MNETKPKLSEQIVKNDGVFADHDPQRLNEKCLVCPQPKAEGFYCSEHTTTIQASHEAWKWDQERETRQKVSRAINRHLKDKSLDYLCQPANCQGLKETIEKEFSRG